MFLFRIFTVWERREIIITTAISSIKEAEVKYPRFAEGNQSFEVKIAINCLFPEIQVYKIGELSTLKFLNLFFEFLVFH
jgi:hypothetical protein